MKKFLALLISVAMVLALVAIPAAAEGEVTFTVDTVDDVNPGDTVAINVTVGGGDYEAHTLIAHLYFDANNLEIVSVQKGSVLLNRPDDSMLILDYTTNTGDVAIGVICATTDINEHGILCTVNFRVKDTCTTNQVLDFEVEDFYHIPLGETQSEVIPNVVTDGAINLVGGNETPAPTDVPPTDVPPTEVPPTEVPPTEVPPTNPPAGGLVYGCYFEEEDEVAEWTIVDNDGDGYNWMWRYGENQAPYVYEGIGCITSASYINDIGPLTPDNWAISPAVTLPAGASTLSLYANGQDSTGYDREHFAVYVGTSYDDPSNMTCVIPETITTHTWTQYTADLSAFAGQTVYVLIRHFNITDQYFLNVDQVEIESNGDVPPTDVPPTDVPPTDVPPTDVPPTDEPVYGATFTMGSEYGVPGGSTVTLDFTIEGEYEAHTLNAVLNYDDAVLEVLDVQPGSIIPDDAFVVIDYETIPGSICIGLVMPGEELEGEGVIATVTFKVADDFSEETPIEVVINEFNYVPENIAIPVDYTTVDGVITPGEEPEPEAVVFTMGSQYEVPGGTRITLPFTIEGEYEAHTMNIFLNYDPEVLTIVGVEQGEVLTTAEGAVVIIDYETVPGSVRIGVVMPDAPMTAEGIIANLTFDVCNPFTETTVIEVVVNEFGYMPVGANNQEPIEYVANNGVVTPVGVPGPSDEPGPGPSDEPGPGPQPPVTGTVSLIGLGVLAIAAGAGVVIFRKKED